MIKGYMHLSSKLYQIFQYPMVGGNMPLQPCKNAKNKWMCIEAKFGMCEPLEVLPIAHSFLVVSSTCDINRLTQH